MSGSRFARLLELARARGSEERRELLRDVTDLFFETRNERNPRESALIGDVLQLVAAEMQDGVLAELSERFAGAEDAPLGLLRDLANHTFEVAGPILRQSPVLDDAVLLQVVSYQSQSHIKAVAQRPEVSEAVSDAIVRLGDDNALDTLMRNEGARLSRPSFEAAVDRARENAALHEGVVRRSDMPLDLLNEMFFVVEQRLRDTILTKNASVDAATLDAALAKTRRKMRRIVGAANDEARKAEAFIGHKLRAGELNGRLLVSLFREGQKTHFLYGLAELTGIDVETAAGLIERQDIDALALICRASQVERPLFVTLAVLTCGGDDAMSRAEQFGEMYNSVPVDAAQRAIRFFKVRKAAESPAAA